MPTNNMISRTDASALIPEDVANDIIETLPEYSAVLKLAKRLPNMSRAQRRLPVVSALPTAYFVTGDNGLKQTTEVNWTNKYIDAEELAVFVPVPKAVLDDADYDIWGEAKPLLKEAFGKAIDEAVFYGTNIPATWTTDLGAAGIVALCNAASQTISLAAYTDLYEALLGETPAGADGALMLLEADGFMATGHVAHLSMRGKLRNVRDSQGGLIFKTSMQGPSSYELDGEPIIFPRNGAMDASQSLMISGQWDQLLYSIRQDLTWDIFDQAVIQDNSGAIVYNLAQQDMIAIRAVMRLGVALPNPINRLNATAATRCAFAVLTA